MEAGLMSNFTIGDHIIVTDDFRFDEVKFKEGQTGTIVDINMGEDRWEGGTLSIQWDFSNGNFHSCNGACPVGTGYNITVNRAKIALAQPSTGNPLPADPRLRGIALKILQMETRFKRRQEAKKAQEDLPYAF
jgi:hypothetical protein